MNKSILPSLFLLIVIFILPISLSSFIHDTYDDKAPKPILPIAKNVVTPPTVSLAKKAGRPITNDPIRFDITANTQQITVGEEIELSVTARLMNISPNLMFFLPGSNAYTLKMLLPAGFQQTGGTLTEFVTGELAYPGKAEATYTVRGFFTSTAQNACFRLLRSHGQANSQSLFVEKATLCLPASPVDKPAAARTAATTSLNWCVEAESGSGNRGMQSSGQASGGQFLGGFGNSSEYADYTITGVPAGGGYTLHLWYTSGDNPQFGIVVNGNLQTASASSNGSWSGPFLEKTVTVNLQAGNNSLRIQGTGGGSFSLDRLCVDGGTGGGGCTPPALSLGTPACNGTSTYLIDFAVQTGASVSSNAGSVQGNYVVNIPVGTNVAITASLNGCATQLTANSPTCNSGGNPPGGNTLTKVRYFFRNDGCGVCRDRCAQSQIQGSTDNVTWTTLAIIPSLSDGWNEVNISTNTAWRYLRYQSSGGCYGELMELEFYNGATKLSGTPFGSPGINASMNYTSAFDGNLSTLWHGNQPGTQNFAGLDLGGGNNPPPPPPSNNGCGTGSGLTGFYTNTADLSDYMVLIRNDAEINFSWGNSSPKPGTVIADGFSVRWFGQVEAPVSGNYTFKTNNDDGTRLWVNGQTIIDDWNGHAPTWQQGSIYLNAGQKYDIEMDFVDYWGGAQAQLYWEYPGQGTQIVPSCRLYPKLTATSITNSAQPNIGPDIKLSLCYVDFNCFTFTTNCKNGEVLSFFEIDGCKVGNGGTGGPAPPGPTGPTGPTNPGGGYPGVPGGPAKPFTLPRPIFTRFPNENLSAEEISRRRFYTAMQLAGIFFTGDEVAVLNEYPEVRANVRNYVNAH